MLKRIFTNPIILIGLGHLVADFGAGAIPIMIPYLKDMFALTYAQVGMIVFLNNLTASVIQPIFGYLTDKKSLPWLMPIGAGFVGVGLALAANATTYNMFLVFIIMTGCACAAFHPQGSKSVSLLSEPHTRGMNMGYFLVFGNSGMAIGSLVMTALAAMPGDIKNAVWFAIPGIAVFLLLYFNMKSITIEAPKKPKAADGSVVEDEPIPKKLLFMVLSFIFVRSTTHAGVAAYIPLFFINYTGMDKSLASSLISIYLIAGAAGTLFGGGLSDKLGRKRVIIASMLIIVPMIYILPRVSGLTAALFLAVIGFFFLASFGPTVVIAQEMMPNHIGSAPGLTIGFSVGLGGCGVMALGALADVFSLEVVLKSLAILPLLAAGFATFLPSDRATD